jgi:hypothetical protein
MTHEEATALVTFIKDHDTRFEATVITDESRNGVQLTRPEDGTRLDPIYTLEGYGSHYIDQNNPSPTIREKWDAWRLKHRSSSAPKQ